MEASTRPVVYPDVSFAELNGAYWIDSDSSLHGGGNCGHCALLREAAAVRATGGAGSPALREDPARGTAGWNGIGWALTTGRPLLVTCAAITVTAALVAVTLG
ncbi:hypothetical protein [Streptomyces sp. NPDC097981]|uniref:hypothetical protein n=1 Tax=Streptomyces sp. NPDC097981 TaxID=3155428 RepID=UPI0033274A78